MRRMFFLALAVVALAACGQSTAGVGGGAKSTSTPAQTGPASGSASGSYTPGSDVSSYAAIGRDIAGIKGAMEPATKGQPVNWSAVGDLFERGGASKKSDGSLRTLAGLVSNSETVTFVREAITGTGSSAGASDAVRRQRVDKGISGVLAEEMSEQLASARGKIRANNLDKASGASHSVDEAWAFFTAEGKGLVATAESRAADFKREGQVKEPVVAALAKAQAAAQKGDVGAFESAAAEVEQGVRYIFYLATYKYLASTNDVGRAEGAAFYRSIAKVVEQRDPAAHRAILDAFASGNAESGRRALNSPPVLAALGVPDAKKVTG